VQRAGRIINIKGRRGVCDAPQSEFLKRLQSLEFYEIHNYKFLVHQVRFVSLVINYNFNSLFCFLLYLNMDHARIVHLSHIISLKYKKLILLKKNKNLCVTLVRIKLREIHMGHVKHFNVYSPAHILSVCWVYIGIY
jgi:hypothetical protein